MRFAGAGPSWQPHCQEVATIVDYLPFVPWGHVPCMLHTLLCLAISGLCNPRRLSGLIDDVAGTNFTEE